MGGEGVRVSIEYKALMTWYESIRTRIGKLTSQPSGSFRTVMTDRDLFILRNFDFLKTQIARQPSRLAVSVSIVKFFLYFMEAASRETVPGFSDRTDTNWTAQPHTTASD